MNFSKNLKLAGLHAFLSPSNYHWLDYDDDKLRRVYHEKQQARLGDEKHAYAQKAIDLKIHQADNGTTMSMYVNDAIGYLMQAEVPLMYSEDCFGTADALGYRNNVLRVSDLKTGKIEASMKQLLIYAGIFCFEYSELIDWSKIQFILRIYQNDAIQEMQPDVADMRLVMSKIATQAALIAYLREED